MTVPAPFLYSLSVFQKCHLPFLLWSLNPIIVLLPLKDAVILKIPAVSPLHAACPIPRPQNEKTWICSLGGQPLDDIHDVIRGSGPPYSLHLGLTPASQSFQAPTLGQCQHSRVTVVSATEGVGGEQAGQLGRLPGSPDPYRPDICVSSKFRR